MSGRIVFTVDSNQQLNIKSSYNYEEDSFQLSSYYDTRTLYIGHQYLTLEVDADSGYLIGLSGYFNLSKCESFDSDIDFNGTLYKSVSVFFEEGAEPGVGYTYRLPGKAQYDLKKKVLKIGNYHSTTKFVQLDNDLILGLDSGKLKCVIVKNI